MTLFDLETLRGFVGEVGIQKAREAMDLDSISHFEFDKRGRIQAGVKPAPPSKEPASYVKITIRGKRQVVDCRLHGKGQWCIHALILAVHHLGVKPEYSFKKTVSNSSPKPKFGFRLEAVFADDKAVFSLRSLSTGQCINQPLTYLARESKLLSLRPGTVDLLAEVADQAGALVEIRRQDLAAALMALKGTDVWLPRLEKSLTWHTSGEAFPSIGVSIKNHHLSWTADKELPRNCIYVPGRPGFVLSGTRATAFAYVPDLQLLGAGSEGQIPLTPDVLSRLLNEKHAFTWVGGKPEQLTELTEPGIRLSVDKGELVGDAGFWHGHEFLHLENWTESRQWLSAKMKSVLLQTHSGAMGRFAKKMGEIRAPWKRGAFRVRQSMAPGFLKDLHVGPGIRLDRETADRWFGITRLSLETCWEEGSLQPFYKIDGERYEHEDLAGGIYGQGGLHLGDGHVLNIDFGQVQKHTRLIEGVTALHDDLSAQKSLLARVCGEVEARIPTVSLSSYWTELLRDYQRDGVLWLLNRWELGEPALLADDMGLGKTIQTLALLDTIQTEKPQLIVVPRSLLANWQEESQRFCKGRKITLHHGSQRGKLPKDLLDKDLVLTTYGTVLRDLDMLYEVPFQMIVLDEAQAIKNPDAQTSQAIFDLWAENRLALTGTPIENRLTELWSIFHFLAPGYLGDVEEIKDLPGPGTPAFEAFRQKARPFLKRRLKSEVAKELPAKQELVLRVPLAPNQRQSYQAMLKGAQKDFGNGKPNTTSILTKLLRLRQICCHLGLVDETQVKAASAKFEILFQHLEDVVASGQSALVFSQFTQLLGLLKFELEERGWNYLYLDGQTKDRQGLVHRFQDGEAPVFLMSLKAGGTGLNLTRASYVFHLDPWWNPMVMAQATDRAHRIGQKQKVISYKIIASDTVEEHILKLQASKKLVAEGLWQDPDALWESLDRETLLGLLR